MNIIIHILIRFILGFNRPENDKHAKMFKEIDKKGWKTIKQRIFNFEASFFNIWSGSRLPSNPNLLLGDGFINITNQKDKTGRHFHFVNPKSLQHVRFDKKLTWFDDEDHYHWYQTRKNDCYFDKYGHPASRFYRNNPAIHIKPFGKIRRKKNEYK